MSIRIDSPGGGAAGVESFNTRTGAVSLTKADVTGTGLAASDVSAAPTARTITAGTGLTGGGDLSANRTLTVAYGTSAGTAAQGNDSRIAAPAASAVTNTTSGLILVTHTNAQSALADLDAAVAAVSRTLLLAPAGAIVETFPRNCTTVGGATANTGVAKLIAVPLLAGQVISNANWAVSASATGPTHQWSALVNAAGTVVAVSGDATSTAITVNTTTTNALSYTVPTTGLYYMLWMSTASSAQPGLWSATGPNANFIGSAFPPILCGTAGSGLTTPYSVGASVGTITQAGSAFYGYLT